MACDPKPETSVRSVAHKVASIVEGKEYDFSMRNSNFRAARYGKCFPHFSNARSRFLHPLHPIRPIGFGLVSKPDTFTVPPFRLFPFPFPFHRFP
jgi:hypothetical protein